jgi:hypothetical protein
LNSPIRLAPAGLEQWRVSVTGFGEAARYTESDEPDPQTTKS